MSKLNVFVVDPFLFALQINEKTRGSHVGSCSLDRSATAMGQSNQPEVALEKPDKEFFPKTYREIYYDKCPFPEEELGYRLANLSWKILRTNHQLPLGEVIFELGERIPCSATDRVIFKCQIHSSEQNCTYPFVLKFKRIGDHLRYLALDHAKSMVNNYVLVTRLLNESPIEGLQVANYLLLETTYATEKGDAPFHLWLEEYLPNFRKFLRYPSNIMPSHALSALRSKRLIQLQALMIKVSESPIIDAQGDFSEATDVIRLCDIETVESMAKFAENVVPSDCHNAINWNLQNYASRA